MNNLLYIIECICIIYIVCIFEFVEELVFLGEGFLYLFVGYVLFGL